MAKATATRRSGYTHDVTIGKHSLVTDEPPEKGGNDEGPAPIDLLAGALASCTAITVEMYADRKGWELPSLRVTVTHEVHPETKARSFEVRLHLPGGLSDEQTERIHQIAGKCQVHKALASQSAVTIRGGAETDL